MKTPDFLRSFLKSPNVSTARFKVEGLHCESCVARVEKAIRRLPGISTVGIDLPNGQAMVEFDPSKTAQDQIREAIISAGYTVDTTKPAA